MWGVVFVGDVVELEFYGEEVCVGRVRVCNVDDGAADGSDGISLGIIRVGVEGGCA